MAADPNLIVFYGTECKHCHELEPLFDRLKEEAGIELTHLEVWHNAENAAMWQELDGGKCGGVPFLFNKKTGKWICGTTTYEKLKAWATGK
ncbi:MAG: hypothetical protein KKA90_03060 [Nanoarchaeota archaeon]|nr:hypothetical protein [Nanoarchaeota archaeon]